MTQGVDNTSLVGNPNIMGQGAVSATMKVPTRSEHRSPMLAGFQRLTGQRIVLGGAQPECTVFGVLHRRAVTQRVSLPTAVDLARRGLTTVVRVEGP